MIYINALKLASYQGLVLEKVDEVIELSQEAWLKPYIDMNAEMTRRDKKYFEKDFFKLRNSCVFINTMEDVRIHWNMKLETTDKKRNKFFFAKLMAIRINKS